MPFHPSRSALRPLAAIVAFVGSVAASPARAVEPFEISDIRVEGLQRTDPGTVFSVLPFRVGDTYNDEKASAALRALFASGLFKDVRIDIDDKVVVVVVDERSIVAAVTFVGLKEFDKDQLSKSLKDSGIGEGLPFDKALIDRAEQEIKRQYLSRSLYAADVVTTITPLERNRVNVTFTVMEGDVAKIRDIRILGSKAFSESTLRGLFDLTTGGWLTWYTKSDRYSRSKLNADLEKLRSYYLNRGDLEFTIESTQVTISPDKEDITVTVTISEGQPYVVTEVKLDGEFLGREAEFRDLVSIKPGQAYSGEDVSQTVRAFTDLYGVFGYAFARVEPRTDIDRATGQVVVVLRADPQRRVYVRRVNVSGNTITRDEVIRREFRQFESSWYDGPKIKLSRDRVDRLGFFSEVSVDTAEIPGQPDQVDLTITVVEKPTGNLLVGAGFSQTDKLSLTASIRKENVFGTGNYLGLEVNTSKFSRTLVVNTVDPYFTVDGISRAIDLTYRTSRPFNSQGDEYQLATAGVAVRFGVPLSEYDTVYLGGGVEQTRIGTKTGVPVSYTRYIDEFGQTSSAYPFTLGWVRDERDSALVPTRGRYTRVNLEWSFLGQVTYLRSNFQVQQFVPLFNRFTLGVNAELGLGTGTNGKDYPIFKNFYGGGLGSVRVFEQSSLGQVDVTGAFLGGSKRFNLNNSLYVPVPGTGNDKTLRIFGFVDAGNVWLDSERVNVDDLRVSAGIGMSWISPVGPLQLSWGAPVRAFRNDRIQRFQFQIGAAF